MTVTDKPISEAASEKKRGRPPVFTDKELCLALGLSANCILSPSGRREAQNSLYSHHAFQFFESIDRTDLWDVAMDTIGAELGRALKAGIPPEEVIFAAERANRSGTYRKVKLIERLLREWRMERVAELKASAES